jgi:hypothetical protein
MVYGSEDLITMRRLCCDKGFVSVNEDKENGANLLAMLSTFDENEACNPRLMYAKEKKTT